jgi:outer membrane biosynthesis protein TonB
MKKAARRKEVVEPEKERKEQERENEEEEKVEKVEKQQQQQMQKQRKQKSNAELEGRKEFREKSILLSTRQLCAEEANRK